MTKELLNQSYAVASSAVKDRIRRPIAPFTTSSLQQEAVKRLNFTTKKTMMLAQQLYEGIALEKGLLSASLPICVRTLSIWPVLPLRKFAIISARFMAMPTCRKAKRIQQP